MQVPKPPKADEGAAAAMSYMVYGRAVRQRPPAEDGGGSMRRWSSAANSEAPPTNPGQLWYTRAQKSRPNRHRRQPDLSRAGAR
ncbi:hypothetical protein CHLRE_08g359166v5 [Chlamydomonas reinhardtii]|uniref:Uncharacterized protein n=1 Tax=Chlamydomonas reinhardtii TaxID=3055 RepID=A0A2K3DGC7_CHLRE|nr:uncharacterized protein CHLRE_08g359166v5 [Chlamydomonas reinhardtii]PNW79591.1 hypothetical protein CHLRE_08g359166v5 [Chlamydomonas reinhardtii]